MLEPLATGQALAITAHELGHALQDHEGYLPLRLRAMLAQAPRPAAEWMQPVFAADATFVIRQFLLVGRRPS